MVALQVVVGSSLQFPQSVALLKIPSSHFIVELVRLLLDSGLKARLVLRVLQPTKDDIALVMANVERKRNEGVLYCPLV
jgi:hypothetical protein